MAAADQAALLQAFEAVEPELELAPGQEWDSSGGWMVGWWVGGLGDGLGDWLDGVGWFRKDGSDSTRLDEHHRFQSLGCITFDKHQLVIAMFEKIKHVCYM